MANSFIRHVSGKPGKEGITWNMVLCVEKREVVPLRVIFFGWSAC